VKAGRVGAKGDPLRRERMYEFLDRLINIAMPRIRDFRGVNGRAFDGRGNYTLGIKEQIIFPEIEYDKIDAIRGMDICISTTAKNRRRGSRAAAGLPVSAERLSTWQRLQWSIAK